jgi:hypothetical protein
MKNEPAEILIEFATQDFKTTKSTSHNQGRGLFSLRSAIEKLNRTATISSEKGKMHIFGGKIELQPLNYSHKGTLIEVKFNLSALEKIEKDDQFDLDF